MTQEPDATESIDLGESTVYATRQETGQMAVLMIVLLSVFSA